MCWPGLTWYSSLVYEGLAFPYTAVVPVWRCRVKCIMCEPIKSPQLTQSFSPFPGWACNENINQCGLSRHDQMCQRKSAPVPLGKNWCHTAPSSCVPNQGQSPSRDAGPHRRIFHRKQWQLQQNFDHIIVCGLCKGFFIYVMLLPSPCKGRCLAIMTYSHIS